MANRRMFSLKIVDTDNFLAMPVSARLLYYDLSMRADDDGFVDSPKKILKIIGCSEDDLKILYAKQYLIPFETGVCVIKHWHVHNLIRADRYNETDYKHEKSALVIENSRYEITGMQNVIPLGNHLAPQVRLGEVREGKESLGEDRLEKDSGKKSPAKSIDYSPEFSEVWDNIYPHMSDRGSKAQTYKNWCGLLKANSTETLTSAAHNYKAHCDIKRENYRYRCSNFYGEMRYFENFITLNLTAVQQEAINEKRNTNQTTDQRRAGGVAFIRRLAEAEAAGFDINDF